ncbi:MAG: hypothetical protein ABIR62_03860 [Dokdonella sp.]|uniref:hypothetical protein n=1 Tax=Dokdonella sp. TaxID=2291710 RepID=UPI0032667F33
MKPPSNEPWVDRAVALLDESAEALDGATLSRLNRARQAALAQRPFALHRYRWTVGVGLAGAALVLALAFEIGHHGVPSPATDLSAGASADADELNADDNPELYENLDFYAWLDARQQDGNG